MSSGCRIVLHFGSQFLGLLGSSLRSPPQNSTVPPLLSKQDSHCPEIYLCGCPHSPGWPPSQALSLLPIGTSTQTPPFLQGPALGFPGACPLPEQIQSAISVWLRPFGTQQPGSCFRVIRSTAKISLFTHRNNFSKVGAAETWKSLPPRQPPASSTSRATYLARAQCL